MSKLDRILANIELALKLAPLVIQLIDAFKSVNANSATPTLREAVTVPLTPAQRTYVINAAVGVVGDNDVVTPDDVRSIMTKLVDGAMSC